MACDPTLGPWRWERSGVPQPGDRSHFVITPITQIVVILAMLPIAHFLPRAGRLVLMSAAGAALLLVVAPGSAWMILIMCLEALLLEATLRNLPKKSMWRQYLPYLLLLNMFYTDIVNGFDGLDLATISVAFSVIRVFMTTKQLLSLPNTTWRSRVGSLAVGGFFLPALVVGPVFSGTTLWSQAKPTAVEAPGSTEWMYRKMFFGWLLAALVAPAFAQLAGGDGLDGWRAPLVLVALFLNLFAAFWGQSLVAEAGASLIGFTVPQNFNKPWLAIDIRDFWNRWHISMAKFVMQYVFLPLNLRGMKPKLATIAAFVFMGLWHEVDIGYLIWGLVHGVVMAYAPKVTPDSGRPARVLSRVGTLSLVIVLSYVANYAFKS